MTTAMSSVSDSITPEELHERLLRGDRLQIVDVREPIEVQIAHFDGAVCIPLSELPSKLGVLDASLEVVVVCHHGIRSRHACDYLLREGFEKVRNLSGGIDRWSVDVDPSTPRY